RWASMTDTNAYLSAPATTSTEWIKHHLARMDSEPPAPVSSPGPRIPTWDHGAAGGGTSRPEAP
ncbi:hypothetical protein, partial [Rhodococcus ruber]|uniref:hypothetical protein n=1 Tax=Rhodococcus ruber TaxID=1830 RepID=UPI001F1D5AEF